MINQSLLFPEPHRARKRDGQTIFVVDNGTDVAFPDFNPQVGEFAQALRASFTAAYYLIHTDWGPVCTLAALLSVM